ncbi:hypothetical protein [Endozoicomonas sp. ONNA1]|uniref:hypothetical protein n=1 Tax=Endozoicomonas sp. ONNA1 TaxID=2828740 RepID=UPI0021485008|nr:hypothetical protein [Endozoicomonas sp. ONNA1]
MKGKAALWLFFIVICILSMVFTPVGGIGLLIFGAVFFGAIRIWYALLCFFFSKPALMICWVLAILLDLGGVGSLLFAFSLVGMLPFAIYYWLTVKSERKMYCCREDSDDKLKNISGLDDGTIDPLYRDAI